MPSNTNSSVISPAFIITPRIACKITAHLDCAFGLKSFNVQCDDVIRAPFGLQNRPYHTHQQAIDALAQYQAHKPESDYSINQGGLCYDYYLLNENWQETLADTNPFERAWLLQIIADCLNAFTLSNDCTHQDYLDASQACFATADAIRRELLRQGVLMNTGKFARDRFIDYLQMSPTNKQSLCVDRIGWHGAVFVLPDRTAGNSDQLTVFQNPSGLDPAFSQAGTLQDWITHIAQPAQGNSRLVFALSLSFAGALLELANEESGGFHLRGSSSIGKSTALLVASSVWGNPSKYRRQWRTTTNGLEGLAVLHNDGLLVLDEISQCEPRDVGQAVYMLANQQGKGRAGRTGGARNAATWRLLVLSSGEESLASLMNQAGQRAKAGQENRLADIAADAGSNMGLFERLHGTDSPSDFAKLLNDAAATYHGMAGMAWVDYLSNDRTACTQQLLAHMKAFNQHIPTAAQGQAMRVSRRFALVAAAGEMATAAGVTGWHIGESTAAAVRCFNDWLVNFGGTSNHEERSILAHVRAFIESHGSSRFESMTTDNNRERIINRVGYFKDTNQGKQYLVFPQAFKNEICKGFDFKHVEKVLLSHKWLLANERGGGASKQRIPDQVQSVRMFALTVKEDDELLESVFSSGNNGNSGNNVDNKGFNSVPNGKSEMGTLGTKAGTPDFIKPVPNVPKPDLSMGTSAKPCNSSFVPSVPSVPAVPSEKQSNDNQGSLFL